MSHNLWIFTVPTANTKDTLFLGNYMAYRRSGYHNGNKVSWHVKKVLWITGEFPPHENYEIDFARNLINALGIKTTYGDGRLTCFPSVSEISYTYITLEYHGDMTKSEAKVMLENLYRKDDGQTVCYECLNLDVNNAIKHVSKGLSLKTKQSEI